MTNHEDSSLAAIDLDERTGANAVASLVMRGDLSGLGPEDRARYYVAVCEGLGLNPHSQPFAFLRLNGKEVLYATRGCTDQLARIHRVTRTIVDGPKLVDLGGTKLILCVAQASHPNGRVETSTATVPFVDPVNVLMKCETKAKRRVTLSLLGLGMLDEMELETIPASAQEPGGGVDLSRADVRPVERKPAQLPDPRDLAPLGAEAPAAPLAFTTPGLSDSELAAMLAMLSACETIDALDATRAEIRPDVSTRATPAQRAHLRAAAEARRAALTPTEPPTPPRSGRKSARNDAATANDTAAEAAPAGEAASASRERIASAGGVRAYLSAKGSRREVEAAVRAHGRHVAGLAQIAAERLDALTQTDADGARPTRDTLLALALRWSAEGPVAEMRRAA